jgi:predicted nucleotidyltransferase
VEPDAILARLKAVEPSLRARGVCHVAIFGSIARGAGGAASDTDIMIEFDPTAPVGVYEYLGVRDYVAGLLDGPVDVVDRDALNPHVASAALADVIDAF